MKKIILVAEDYDDAREYMTFLLKSQGYDVYEAENGLQAIDIAKEYPPDLILMDISMPIMDGLTATKIIRNSTGDISQVPIIAITAFGDIYKEEAIEAGCNHLVTKPVDFDAFEPLIKEYVAH